MSPYFFQSATRSALGLVRDGNEDSAFTDTHIVAVADGMGGHVGGEIASSLAIKKLAALSHLYKSPDIDSDSVEDLLLNSVHSIDNELASYIEERPELEGMGTTLTSLVIVGSRVALLHVGDSRAYRVRGNSIDQLSLDHTVMQELISQGTITPADVSTHPQRSMLTQVLMGTGIQSPALMEYEIKEGDRFILCSDGLTNVLTEKEIKSLLQKDRTASVEKLIEATYLNGAPDNVTVVVADISTSSSDAQSFWGAAQ